MNEKKTMSRRTARKHIFWIVYQSAFHKDFEVEFAMEQIEEAMSQRERDFILNETTGTLENLEQIDDIIGRYSTDWTVDRLGKVDLAVLRIALFEMLFNKQEPIPVSVSINEAVELAKTYGDDNSPTFINGLLAKVVREHNGPQDLHGNPNQSVR